MAKVKLGKKEFLVDCDVIDANGCEVSAADCNALCARMRSGEINRVTELFLGHNQICDDGAKAIAEILKEKSCVQKLWISDNQICDEGAKAIAEGLKENTSAQCLYLERNNVSVTGVCRLIACILHNPKLTQLYLDHQPSACVGSDAWRSEGLPVPPIAVQIGGWSEVLKFLRASNPKVQLSLSRHRTLTVPLRASVPLPKITVSPSVEGSLHYSSKSPFIGVNAAGGNVTGLMVAKEAEISVAFSPKDSATYCAATMTITVRVEFEQERYDQEGNMAKVHEFFSSSGQYGCNVPFPDMNYVALCPNYFRNVRQTLQSPPQVPTPGSLDAASEKLIANARLPLGCTSSKENGGLQCALHLFIRRALAMKPSPDVSSVTRALQSWIIKCGVDVSARDSVPMSSRTALHQLAISGSDLSVALVDVLLAAIPGQDVKQKLLDMKDASSKGRSALEIAVEQGNVAFAAELVRKGASFQKDFLKRRNDDRDRWQPVVIAVIQTTQQHKEKGEKFFLEIFGVLPEFDQETHAVEEDQEVVDILQGKFKPTSTPSLRNVERMDPGVACLIRTLALTRFPRHCALAKEARRGLRKYAKMLDSPDAEATGDFVSSESALLVPDASGRSIIVHRWVLAVGAHIAYAERKPFITHALLQQLQQLQSNQQLASCDQILMQAANQAMLDSPSDDFKSVASQLFGQADSNPVRNDEILRSMSEQQRAPLEALMKLIGLKRQKELGIQMFSSAQDQEFLRQKGMKNSVVERVQNFVFAGNPGCGKTAVARLYADILHKSGIRKGNTFIQMTGAEALKKGSSKFADEMKKLAADRSKTGPSSADLPQDRFLVNENVEVKLNAERVNARIIATPASKITAPGQAQTYDVEYEDGRRDSVAPGCITRPDAGQKQGGVLFIDEVYDLDPAKNPEGKLILAEIMRIAEDYRDTVSVILAGYKDDIDNKIFSFNIGMASRFETVYFDDFTPDELESIWKLLCKEKGYAVGDDVSAVVRRRLSKQSGYKGFGNARSVRKLFESAALPAMHRYRVDSSAGKQVELRIVMEDVIGQRPDRRTNTKLDAALKELDNLVGVPEVKASINAIVESMLSNYDKELQAQDTDAICLNRVFVGNPGTGKTTVAKLYARILCAAGMLSKDDLVERTASDFIGDAVGVSAQKTINILKLSEGKVLLIDEAYNLFDGRSVSSGNVSYGKQVLDTIVEKVSGSPGEDRAIIMIGYEHEMQAMFRGSNPGLTRRFDSNHPWRFTDFSDDDLLQVAVDTLGPKAGMVPLDVTLHMVKKVTKQRMLHNFGNAGLMKTAVASALERRNMRLHAAKAGDIRQIKSVTKEDVDGYTAEQRKLFEDPMSVLEEMADVGDFKPQMRRLQVQAAERRAQGRDLGTLLRNWTFLGKPGTGKTTVARKMAALLHSFGLLPTDKLVETSALDLTGEFVGQSKSKMQEKMDEARGGVLFIDEAYELGAGSYGNEVMTKLVQLLTDQRYEHKMVVILAGYPDKMAAMFTQNTGLKSRFKQTLEFEDWTSHQLSDLIIADLKKSTPAYAIEDEAAAIRELSNGFDSIRSRDPLSWANARDSNSMRQLMEDAYCERAAILRAGSRDPDTSPPPITAEDAKEAVRIFIERRPPPRSSPVPPQHHGQQQCQSASAQPVHTNADAKEEESAASEARQPAAGGGGRDGEGEEFFPDIEDVFGKQIFDMKKSVQDMHADDPHRAAVVAEIQRQERERQELIRKEQERLRLLAQEQAARDEAEKKRLHARAIQLQEEKERRLREERDRQQLQEKLRRIGRCPAGYAWTRVPGGYVCEGGSHHVFDGQL